MGETSCVKVADSFHQLLEEMACELLLEATCLSNVVEERAIVSELKEDVLESLHRVACDSFAVLNQVDDVWMLDHAQCLNFGVDKSLEVFVSFENFHRVFVALVILGNLDLAASAGAQGSSNAKVIEERLRLRLISHFLK